MKSTLSLLLCYLLLVSLSACKKQIAASTEPSSSTQVVNPVRTVDGPDAFPGDLRFYMCTPENAEDMQFSIIFAEIAQIKFVFNGEAYTLRGSWERDHMSGVYGPFEETGSAIALDHKHGSCQISIRYTTEGVAVADWSLPSMTFSLSSGQNTDRDAFSQLVTQIASSQLDRCYEEELNSRQQFMDLALSGHIEILSDGTAYYPYTAGVYSMFWDGQNMLCADGWMDLPKLKQAEVLPSIPYCDDFTVNFTNSGTLDIIYLYDEDFQRLDAQWNLNCFAELEPGTYFAEIVICEYGNYIPEADETEYRGYACVFELLVE